MSKFGDKRIRREAPEKNRVFRIPQYDFLRGFRDFFGPALPARKKIRFFGSQNAIFKAFFVFFFGPAKPARKKMGF